MLKYPFVNVEPTPTAPFENTARCMVILAHQDDELTFAGLVRRLPPTARFVWVTNGDGLSDQLKMPDREYAEKRRLETVDAMKVAGIGENRLRFLGNGEKEIYAKMASLADDSESRADVLSYFGAMSAEVTAEVLAFRPDFIFTHAWQGGQPEHDLTHFMAVNAAARLKKDCRVPCTVYEIPEYELANTVFLRFPPWKKGPVHEIRLSDEDLAVKQAMMDCYESQKRGFMLSAVVMAAGGAFEKAAALLSGRGLLPGAYGSREYFAPVPDRRDYRACPHFLDHLEYIGDDWKGRPISFQKMVVPIVCAIQE